MLRACFADPPGTAKPPPGLEPFQVDAVIRLRAILRHRGGAILADSVGLGKTHVAVALVREEIGRGGCVIVAAPAQLRLHWSRHLRGIARWRWISHTSLSRSIPLAADASLIVVDEAHAFRNPDTRRYAALALLCEHARVLHVTATPVNNSLSDFLHLVRLFASPNAFTDIGVPDLAGAVDAALRGGSADGVRRIADAVMVRRTRRAVAAWRPPPQRMDGAEPLPQSHLTFPASGAIERLHYDLRSAWPELLDAVTAAIPRLAFPAHDVMRHIRTDDIHARHLVVDPNVELRTFEHRAACELMRLGLLKRLESGPWAFRASVSRHIRILERFTAAAADGRLFDPRTDMSLVPDIDGASQLSLDAMTLKPWPRALDRHRITAAAYRDLDALRTIRELMPDDQAIARSDPKLALLRLLLDDNLRAETVLLFTEYQDTARGLWRALSDRAGVALVHGAEARLGRGRSSRRAVIERFAPLANRARVPHVSERVSMLIATDVLAEGLNLQDARVVISYDLPWNPVRLVQRIGRIDRLGSPHSRIRALAFVPDRGVDDLLGLMTRIRRKLRHIRVVGGDAPWSIGGARSATRIIDAMDAAADARELARAAWCRMPALRAGEAAGSPDGGHACAGSAGRRRTSPEDVTSMGAATWRHTHAAALCCFDRGRDMVLVLTQNGRAAEIATHACWSALRESIGSGIPGDSDCEGIKAEAAAAARVAERVLALPGTKRSMTSRSSRRHREPAAVLAGAAVLRWLAALPGGPTPEEGERADQLLGHLAHGGRAGLDVRLRRAIRGAHGPADAVEALLKLSLDLARERTPGQASLVADERVSTRDSFARRASGPHRAGGTRNERRPRLIAVLLLRPSVSVPHR